MDRTRSWTDLRDGKLWSLRRGLGVDPDAVLLLFTRGTERRTVLLGRDADLHSLTNEEIEALLDQALRVHGPNG